MRTLAALSIVFLTAVGCTSDSQLEAFPGLAQQIRAYYELEKQQNWREAWAYRVPIYRQSVPVERYVSVMTRDANGWTLKDAKVRRVVKQGNLVRVEMEFIDIPPKNWGGAPVPLQELSTEDKSVWEFIDGKWQAWETGNRAYLSLNGALVSPNNTFERDARKSGARPSM